MAFPLIAAAAATVGNALLQKSANKQNIENQWQLYSAQNQRQDWLNANSALIQRQALHKAGLNINSEYGGYPNLLGATPTKSDVQAPQIDPNVAIGAAQLLQNKPLVDAQVGKVKAETEEIRSEIPKNQAQTKQIIQETSNALEKHGILHFENETQRERFNLWQQSMYSDIDLKEAQASNVNIDTRLKDFESQLFDATFEDRKKYYAELVNEIINRQDLQDAEKRQALASASKAYADASFTRAQEHRLRTLLTDELKKIQADWYKSDQEGKKVGFEIDYLIAQTANVDTHTQWIEFEEYCKSIGMGAGAIGKLMRYTPYGRKIPKK